MTNLPTQHNTPWQFSDQFIHRILLGLVVLLWGGMAYHLVTNPPAINHDVAFMMSGGTEALHGNPPGVGFVDINLAITVWVHAVPVLLHYLTGWSNQVTLYVTVWVLVAFSAIMYFRIMRHIYGKLTTYSVLICILIIYYNYHILPNFAQREHLFLLLYLPFFFLRVARWMNKSSISPLEGVLLGVLAAFGAYTKPLYIVLTLLIELGWFLRYRRIRPFFTPEFIAFACIGISGALYTFFLLPIEARIEYFDYLMPLATQSYDLYGYIPWYTLLQYPIAKISLTLAVSVLIYRFSHSSDALVVGLHWFLMGSLVTFLVQQKGFANHYIIVEFSIWLILAYIIHDANILQFAYSKMIFIGLMVLFSINPLLSYRSTDPYTDASLEKFLRANTQTDDAVSLWSTFYDYPMLLRLGLRNGDRYGLMGIFTLIYKNPELDANNEIQYRSPEQMTNYERRIRANLRQDLLTRTPKYIILHQEERRIGEFYFKDYMEATNFVAEVMPNYIFMDQNTLPGFWVWRYNEPLPDGVANEPFNFGGYYDFLAYRLSTNEPAPCEVLTMQSWWETTAPIDNPYNAVSVSLALAVPDGGISGVGSPFGVTDLHKVFAESRNIAIPCDAQPGDTYSLLLLVIDTYPEPENLVVFNSTGDPIDRYLYLTTITVQAAKN